MLRPSWGHQFRDGEIVAGVRRTAECLELQALHLRAGELAQKWISSAFAPSGSQSFVTL